MGRVLSGFGPSLIELSLTVILALLAARLFWALLAPLDTPIGEPTAQPTARAADEALPAKNPFPKIAAVLPTAAEPLADVEETTLDLTLTGVWAGENDGSATIKLPDGRQRRFVVGDVVVPGVTLDAVYSNQVMLLRNGVREALKFENKLVAARPVAPPRQNPGSRAGAIATATPDGLAEIIRLAPASNPSGGVAITIYASRNRAAFNALGFKEGDRLVSINGTAAPNDAASLSALLGRLQRAQNAIVEVERNGETVKLDLSLSSLGVN